MTNLKLPGIPTQNAGAFGDGQMFGWASGGKSSKIPLVRDFACFRGRLLCFCAARPRFCPFSRTSTLFLCHLSVILPVFADDYWIETPSAMSALRHCCTAYESLKHFVHKRQPKSSFLKIKIDIACASFAKSRTSGADRHRALR